MYLNDLNSAKHSAEKINRILAETFGYEIDLTKLSSNVLNRMLATTDSKIRTIKESSYNYWENPSYNKLNLIAHQLRTYINEVAPARHDGKKFRKRTNESVLVEQDLEQAEVLLAAKEMVDTLQKMIEDVAEMQVQELLPIVDAMKEQLGFDVATQFNEQAESALSSLLDTLKSTKEAMDNAVLQASGEPVNQPTDMDVEIDTDFDDESPDEFDGAEPAAGVDNTVGRELK